HGRDVVDRLVGIKLDALAAGVRQRVDDVGLDLQQAQLEHLEEADRAGPDDDGVGFDHQSLASRINSASLPDLSFHSSASGGAGLRLVMLFQPGARDSSALSLMNCTWSGGVSSSA